MEELIEKRAELPATQHEFTEKGQVFVPQLLSRDICRLLRDYVEFKMKTDGLVFDNEPDFIPKSLTLYGDPFTEAILKNLVPVIERITRLKLYPTYSFLRVYKEGDVLPKHRDRLSGDIGSSICIGYDYDDSEYQWPIFMEDAEVTMKPGDAVVYRGIRNIHWREAFERDWHLQIFMFFVDQTSEYAEDLKFDSRESLGLPKSAQRLDLREYEKKHWAARGFESVDRGTFHD